MALTTNNPKLNSFQPLPQAEDITSQSIELIENIILHAKKTGHSFGFLMINILNYCDLLLVHNEELIQSLVEELLRYLGEIDDHYIIQKISRDKFLVIIEHCGNLEHLNLRAEQIFNEIHNFGFHKKQITVYFHTNIGGELLNAVNYLNPFELINRCYIAVKIAEKDGYQNFCSYEKAKIMQNELQDEMKKANYLHQAIEKNRLTLAFQPVIDAKTGEIGYYESLLRIVSKSNELISVGPFIKLAEKFGFINLIDELVVTLATSELISNPNLKLSFNLSAISVHHTQILDKISQIVKSFDNLSNRMIVEITETALMRDLSSASIFTNNLKALGCHVALDDFGAGYSSFKELQMLNVDVVKIDGSFIQNIHKDKNNQLFVKVLLEICQNFNMKSVAEFVESREIAETLMDMGIDYMQGFYFSQAIKYNS
ncbi:EAL domain-containing protein [Rickettsiales endosymbiont of Stachyamoeba lipophora]|uniref:EAL domain-containing protein n=1 Tax=Rickettsiales endosymbiont of Stachyamoeba lipophora TaxID=2486578 RepID=UPI000F653CE1|nr:EAL domain-containing protein [Rickettsiales endosymbiont of Stachyamoeba lipophora]AZL15107.1 EAL domain-containing protein [Rickettsiales endosymbiont of Stachyamoeba lipophora]